MLPSFRCLICICIPCSISRCVLFKNSIFPFFRTLNHITFTVIAAHEVCHRVSILMSIYNFYTFAIKALSPAIAYSYRIFMINNDFLFVNIIIKIVCIGRSRREHHYSKYATLWFSTLGYLLTSNMSHFLKSPRDNRRFYIRPRNSPGNRAHPHFARPYILRSAKFI